MNFPKISLFGLVVVLGLSLVAPDAAFAQQQAAGIVKIATGDLHVVRRAAKVAVAVGDPIHVGDRLETGPEAAIGVTLKDGTLLSLGANSVFVIDEFLFAPERESLSFIGTARAGSLVYTSGTIGRLAPDKVRVNTPFGTIGTRGTRFAVRMPDAQR